MHIILSANEEIEKVQKCMKYIKSRTCVKFVLCTKESDYIIISKNRAGCFAYIGYAQNIGAQPVSLQPSYCINHAGTIQHELLHILGLLHEQFKLG